MAQGVFGRLGGVYEIALLREKVGDDVLEDNKIRERGHSRSRFRSRSREKIQARVQLKSPAEDTSPVQGAIFVGRDEERMP
jgi:hypothetical protein